MMSTKVSFIIPHKGRTEMLIKTIRSIISQDYDQSKFEIILVTQNSDLGDEVPEIFEIGNLKVVHCPVSDTIARLRNKGVVQSQGSYLAFIDADIYLSENWLNQFVSTLENADYILVSGAQINSINAPPLEKIRTALSNSGLDTEVKFLPGRNLFLRRSDFDKVGGFPEQLVTCEDYYFTDKISDLGKLFYTSKATYIHLGEDKKYIEMFRKEIWRGQSNLHSIRGRRISISEFPSFVIPVLFATMLFLSIAFLFLGNLMHASISFAFVCLILIIYISRLRLLTKGEVSLINQLKFYCCYFPARAIGTFWGMLKVLKLKS